MTTQNCETCGTTFDASALKGEVVSSRILCPACTEKRRAQKAAAKSAGAAPAATRASAPARTVAAAPAAPARGAAPVRTATRAPEKPARGGAAAHKPRDYGHQSGEDLEGEGKTVMIGWSIAGVFIVVGLVVLFFVMNTHKTEAQRKKDHDDRVNLIMNDIKAMDPTKPGGPDQILDYIKAQGEFANDPALRSFIAGITHTALKEKELEKNRKDIRDVYDREVKAKLGSVGSASSADLIAMLRAIRNDVQPKESVMEEAFKTQLLADRRTISKALVPRLHDEAKATNPSAATASAAIAAYNRADDEIYKIWDQAKTDNDKELQELSKSHLDQIIAEYNKFAAETFTHEFMSTRPAVDLLAAGEKPNWIPSAGLNFTFEGGVLKIQNDTERLGIISTGLRPEDNWRDYLLDINYTVTKGEALLHLRHGPKADPGTNAKIDLGPSGPVPSNQGIPVGFQVQMAGGKMVIRKPGAEAQEWNIEMKRPKGAIGIAVPPGAGITINSLTLRLMK